MLKIITTPLSRLRNSQHLFLMTEFIRLVLDSTVAKLGLESYFPGFQTAVDAETVAIEVEHGSMFTEKIDELIVLREKYYGAYLKLIDNGLDHFDQTVVDAAKLLERLHTKYSLILHKTKAEKMTDFANLSGELKKPEYADAVLKIGAVVWTAKIQEINDLCTVHVDSRDKEGSVRPDGNVHDARMVVDSIYNTMIERINASVIMNGQADYAEFIDQLNLKIENLKNTMAQQQGAKNSPVATATPTA